MLKETLKALATNQSDDPALLSYRDLRRAVGWLGILLPFVLMLGSIINNCEVQPSISHYYYTNMREIFEGTLFAVALFLFSYKGYSKLDSIISNIAGLFCIGVALFSTDMIAGFPGQAYATLLFDFQIHSTIHLLCAALFFLTLAFMSIKLFTKTKGEMTHQKRKRNRVYIGCGIIMIASVACLGIYFVCKGNPLSHIVIVCETVALLAFGLSWLTKGETIFRD